MKEKEELLKEVERIKSNHTKQVSKTDLTKDMEMKLQERLDAKEKSIVDDARLEYLKIRKNNEPEQNPIEEFIATITASKERDYNAITSKFKEHLTVTSLLT